MARFASDRRRCHHCAVRVKALVTVANRPEFVVCTCSQGSTESWLRFITQEAAVRPSGGVCVCPSNSTSSDPESLPWASLFPRFFLHFASPPNTIPADDWPICSDYHLTAGAALSAPTTTRHQLPRLRASDSKGDEQTVNTGLASGSARARQSKNSKPLGWVRGARPVALSACGVGESQRLPPALPRADEQMSRRCTQLAGGYGAGDSGGRGDEA
jgi:hypothetical protein